MLIGIVSLKNVNGDDFLEFAYWKQMKVNESQQ